MLLKRPSAAQPRILPYSVAKFAPVPQRIPPPLSKLEPCPVQRPDCSQLRWEALTQQLLLPPPPEPPSHSFAWFGACLSLSLKRGVSVPVLSPSILLHLSRPAQFWKHTWRVRLFT